MIPARPGEHHLFQPHDETGPGRGPVRRPGIHFRVTVHGEDRVPVGIHQLGLQGVTTVIPPVPVDEISMLIEAATDEGGAT